mmetsp:Transcript_13389/g.14533  ORF Transcript_13389/g.14533 Transcript_13389/m.14533 type:complete len:97 (-) Transcript_13389:875-1165(-)
MHLKERGPGQRAPMTGAGKTLAAKVFHLSVCRSADRSTCSEAESQLLPTEVDEANRRLPSPDALAASSRVSCTASPAMAAESTLTRGKKSNISVVS